MPKPKIQINLNKDKEIDIDLDVDQFMDCEENDFNDFDAEFYS
jgi:hypothetical protein